MGLLLRTWWRYSKVDAQAVVTVGKELGGGLVILGREVSEWQIVVKDE
jgi:hypothetical protein